MLSFATTLAWTLRVWAGRGGVCDDQEQRRVDGGQVAKFDELVRIRIIGSSVGKSRVSLKVSLWNSLEFSLCFKRLIDATKREAQ